MRSKKGMVKAITTPIDISAVQDLRSGDKVALSGDIFVAFLSAHSILTERLKLGQDIPVNLQGQIILYCPVPAVTAASSYKLIEPVAGDLFDQYTPQLLDQGLKGIIGKGKLNLKVSVALQQNQAVYFTAVSGTAALLSKHILSQERIPCGDIVLEDILKITVRNLPLLVALDCNGDSVFEMGRARYLQMKVKPSVAVANDYL